MNELQRQAYMQAMGVDCYMLRLTLPGAKASVLCEMPALVENTVSAIASTIAPTVAPAIASTIAPATVPTAADIAQESPGSSHPSQSVAKRSSGSAAAMQALFGDTPSNIDKRSRLSPKTERSESDRKNNVQSKIQEIPNFALTLVRGASILIIDDGLPAHIASADYTLLIRNILFALGETAGQLSLDPFIWPMVKNSSIDQSEPAARQTLEAFLAKQVSQLNKAFIIAMGDNATHYLCGEKIAQGGLVTHSQIPARIICTQSAVNSLDAPSLKRQIWHELQPLFSELKNK
jgi:hypothetical protein